MKKTTALTLVLLLGISFGFAQQNANADSLKTMKSQKKQNTQKVFYGGTVGFNFGNYTRFSAEPLVGYRVSPKFSVGAKFRYEYINDGRYNSDVTYHNYGASLFARYRVIPQIYLHAEPAYMSYQYSVNNFESVRDWVPFLFVGGGYVQRMGKNVFAYAEVLFDLLQNDKSPYKNWEPFYSLGVSIGF